MSFTPSENPITHPERESYTELRPFRFWCQKVLPLVYDDTLSYYELLCKVVDYLNKTMEDVDNMNTDMDTLYSNFQEFQEGTIRIYNELVDYVNTYFDELDVQEEINNKLDAMVTSGELVTILQPSIASTVDDWLENNITPVTPVLDSSLTLIDGASQSRAVGLRLNPTFINNELTWTLGLLNQNDTITETNIYSYTDYVDVSDYIAIITVNTFTHTLLGGIFYNENHEIVEAFNYSQTPTMNPFLKFVPDNAKYVRINANTDRTNLVPVIGIKKLYSNVKIDSTLSLTNYASDARVVGLRLNPIFEENEISWTLGLLNANGTITETSIYSYSDYIDLSKYTAFISVNTFQHNTLGAVFYDENKTLIGSYNYTGNINLPYLKLIPDHTKYVRINANTDRLNLVPFIGILPIQKDNKTTLLTELDNFIIGATIDNNNLITKWGSASATITQNDKTVSLVNTSGSRAGFNTPFFSTGDFPSNSCKLTFACSITAGNIIVWLRGRAKTSGESYIRLEQYTISGEKELLIDFAYHDVYSNIDVSQPIAILFSDESGISNNFVVENVLLKSAIFDSNAIPSFETRKIYEIIEDLETTEEENYVNNETVYLYSPNGTKYILRVNNDGSLKVINGIPNKSVFIGNSLLMGWGTFGMASTDITKDYYYHVTNAIHDLNNNAVYSRYINSGLEHAETNAAFENAWTNVKQNIASDTDLIVIQLGDNVNTSGKIAQFEGISFYTMLNDCKQIAPNARIVWVGTWYNTIKDWLKTECFKMGIEFIDILDLAVSSNKAQYGDIITRTTEQTQTFTGSYTIDGNSLVMSIVIYGITYEVTLPDYISVTQNGNTFTVVSMYTVVDSSGVASHPNNAGMLAIANRINKYLGYEL